MKINKIIIKNINLSPNLDEFAKNFIKISISSLVNYFLKYDNFPNHIKSRDIITITTLLNFLRQIMLL